MFFWCVQVDTFNYYFKMQIVVYGSTCSILLTTKVSLYFSLFNLVYYYCSALNLNVLCFIMLRSDTLISSCYGRNFYTTFLRSVDLSLYICHPLSCNIFLLFKFWQVMFNCTKWQVPLE
jgi:hypothetical protein